MRLAAMLILSMLAAPALAQGAAGGRIDWSKPVVGVDGNIRAPSKAEEQAKPIEVFASQPIEVYTREEMKACGAMTEKACIDMLRDWRSRAGCRSDGSLPPDEKTGTIPRCPPLPAARQ